MIYSFLNIYNNNIIFLSKYLYIIEEQNFNKLYIFSLHI